VSTETNQSESGKSSKLPLQLPQLPGPAGDSAQPSQPRPAPDAQMLRRRKFLNWLCIGLGSASLGSIVWAVIGFMLAPLESESERERQWRVVGKLDNFKIGSTTIVKLADASSVPWAGYAGKTAAWLRREDKSTFTCFSINCTHLGCPVRWIETAQLFMCPCHGGVYYQDGAVAAGPPPLPLPQYKVRVRNGRVEVLASPVPITRGMG
jgi:menaquinol-cytochrome c reductase iron-sulfur subunit